MIRAIIWKEFREQGLIALSLVVLGSGVLVAAAMLADPPVDSAPPSDVIRFLGAGRLATLMLAVTAGMVCGGAVFAAEREAGTIGFLESLPTSRWVLWRAKFVAGLGLAVIQIALLVLVATGLGLVPNVGWALTVGVYALLAFAWGLLGSTTAQTTLGSVGLAIPAATLAAVVLLVPVIIFFQNPRTNLPRPTGAAIFLMGMFAIPLVISARVFTRSDRDRAAEEPSRRRKPRLGLSALHWLTVRQSLVVGLVISIFALMCGLMLLVPSVQPVLIWPGLALVAGVLAGVTTFADEQTRGAARFWGEQRLPIGRLWVVKTGLHLVFCLWLLVLLAAPLVVQAQFRDEVRISPGRFLSVVFRSLLFDELGRQGWKYLLVPAVYGFAAGQLAGLVFRKLVVACGVAGIVGGVGAAAWVPSLLSGGVLHWQVWLPPAIALLLGRLLLRAWTADRLAARGPLGLLFGGSVACLLALGAGLGYRVLEVPSRPDAEADIEFVAGLIPFDQNRGGRDFKTAAERYARLATTTGTEMDQRGSRPLGSGGRPLRIEERLIWAVARGGWPADDPDLAAWLDQLFSPTAAEGEDIPWYTLATGAANFPIGVYEYPQTLNVTGGGGGAVENARRMAVGLLGRALQRQAAGDPGAMIPALRTTIALARTLRNGSGVEGLRAANDVERIALAALDRWLSPAPAAGWAVGLRFVEPVAAIGRAWIEQVTPSPQLIRESLALLEPLDGTEPFNPTPHLLAERYALRESQKAPGQWLPRLITPLGANEDAANPEVDLVGLGWAVPWERERTRRLLGLGFEAGPPNNYQLIAGRPGAEFLVLRNRSPAELDGHDRMLRGSRRAAIVKLALRAYRAERGRYPDKLAHLVATGYLRQVPTDPYDDTRELGYRISRGESLPISSQGIAPFGFPAGGGPAEALPGQPILWSIGPDRVDQGGTTPTTGRSGPARAEDLIYPVPVGYHL